MVRIFLGIDPGIDARVDSGAVKPDHAVLSKIPAGYKAVPWTSETKYGHLKVDDYLLVRHIDVPYLPQRSILFKVVAKAPVSMVPNTVVPWSPVVGLGQIISSGVHLMVVGHLEHPQDVGNYAYFPDEADTRDPLSWSFYTTYEAPVMSAEEQAVAAAAAKERIIREHIPTGFIPEPWRQTTNYGDLNVGDYLSLSLDPRKFGGGLPKNLVVKAVGKKVVKDRNGNDVQAVDLNYLYNDIGPVGITISVLARDRDPGWRLFTTHRRPNPPSSDTAEEFRFASAVAGNTVPIVIGIGVAVLAGLGLWLYLKKR